MHLIGRKSRQFRALQFVSRSKQLRSDQCRLTTCWPPLPDRGNTECLRDRLLDQTLAQSDAQIASENFDDVLTFARRQS